MPIDLLAERKKVPVDLLAEKPKKREPGIYPVPGKSSWQRFKESIVPGIDPERATQAIIDSEALGISPLDAYEYGDTLDDVEKGDPRLQTLRLSTKGKIDRRWDNAVNQAKQNYIGYQMLFDYDNPAHEEALAKLEARQRPEPIDQNMFEYATGAAAEILPIMLRGTARGAERGLQAGMLGVTAAIIAGQAGPQALAFEEIVTVPVTFTTLFGAGMTAGSLESIAEMEIGSKIIELRGLTDSKGNRIDPAIVKTVAVGVGALNALIEVAQIKRLLKTIPGGEKLFGEITQEITEKVLRSGTLKTVAAKYLKKYGNFLSAETAQELTQEVVGIVGTELSKVGTDIPATTLSQIIEQLKETALKSVAGFAVLGVPGHAVGIAKETGALGKLAEPLKGEAGAIFPEGGEGKSYEESLKAKAKELGIKDHIGEKEDINAIQRNTFGAMVKAGKVDEAVTHAVEGVEKHDKQTINDAIVAEEMKQVAEAKKEDRDAIRANFKELKAKFEGAVEGEVKIVRTAKPMHQVKFNPQKHSLKDFIATKGGINVKAEEGGGLTGELKKIRETKSGFGIVTSEGGLSVDKMRMAAIEEGFIDEWASPSEFLELLEKDLIAEETLEKVWSTQKDIEVDIEKEADALFFKEEGVRPKEIEKLKNKIEALKEEHKEKLVADRARLKAKEREKVSGMKRKTELGALRQRIKDRAASIKALEGKQSQIEKIKTMSKEKIAKIKTEKEIIQRRRQKIRSIRDTLMLTNAQLKKISKKDMRLMSDYEFKQYADQIYEKAIQLQETAQAKAELDDLINRMELKSYNNLIEAYGLPPISKMTTEELREFHDTLSQYEKGDAFLSPARIENIERTDVEGARTWREVMEHMAKQAGIPVSELGEVKIKWTDMFKGDAALTEKGPFWELIVKQMAAKKLQARAKFIELEKEMNPIVKASNKSRGLTLKEILIPQDKQVQAYMEAETKEMKAALAESMTPEQIEYAHYMGKWFRKVYDQMFQDQVINGSRFTDDNYYAHIRRGFIETIADGDIKEAFTNVLKHEAEDSMVFGILPDTGGILAYEKFFSHIMYRSGNMVPTANVTRAFKTYMNTYFEKQALDEIVVLIDIYAQAVSPKVKTRKGLQRDPAIKEFINKWLNNKKGRKINFSNVIPQSGTIDILLRGGKALTTMLHLGANIPVQMAAPAGEQSATFINIGAERHALAIKRYGTKQGLSIVKKYENFIGKSLWEEMALPDKEASERLHDALFGLFSVSYREANKVHLLSALTESEFKSGEITNERLAEIKIEMARYRHVQGMESIVGATSLGKAGTQYKSWALPILGRTARNLSAITKDYKTRGKLTEKQRHELYRGILTTITLMTIYSLMDKEDEKSFFGQIKAKIMRETLTFSQGLSPSIWLSTPVLMEFVSQFGKNVNMWLKMEKYKRSGELKGPKALQRQFTPVAVKQITRDKKPKSKRRWESSIER